MTRRALVLGATLLLGGAASRRTMTLTPPSHDFGQIVLGAGSPVHKFQLTGTAPLASRGVLKVTIGGPDAGEFVIDDGWLVPPAPGPKKFPPGSCLSITWNLTGPCDYVIKFTPQSLGRKTAQLIVDDPGTGETATATLTGEGIFGCRAYLVACNYAYNYSGTYTVTTDDAAPTGNQRGRWFTTIDVSVDKGTATCTGVQNDWEEEWTGSKLDKRSTATGTISGPGLFAIEFRMAGGGLFEYVMSFACPSPTINTTVVDHISGTSSSGSIPSEPAVWSRGGIAADPQTASQIGMSLLSGTQKDPRAPDGSNSGVTGMTTMTWSLKRW